MLICLSLILQLFWDRTRHDYPMIWVYSGLLALALSTADLFAYQIEQGDCRFAHAKQLYYSLEIIRFIGIHS